MKKERGENRPLSSLHPFNHGQNRNQNLIKTRALRNESCHMKEINERLGTYRICFFLLLIDRCISQNASQSVAPDDFCKRVDFCV